MSSSGDLDHGRIQRHIPVMLLPCCLAHGNKIGQNGPWRLRIWLAGRLLPAESGFSFVLLVHTRPG